MPVCGYVVVPREGKLDELCRALSATPACTVALADNADLLLLVTVTEGAEEDERLRAHLQAMPQIQALLLTFGEVDPDTTLGDPVADLAGGRRPRAGRRDAPGGTSRQDHERP